MTVRGNFRALPSFGVPLAALIPAEVQHIRRTRVDVRLYAPKTPTAQRADLLDQFTLEARRSHDPALGLGFRDIIGRAERKSLQTDLRVVARERRGHDDDEIALLLEQQRQCRNAVELGHVDVEHDDIGIDLFDLVDRLAAVTQGAATISRSGSSVTQRATRLRTTTASSTTMTRIGAGAMTGAAGKTGEIALIVTRYSNGLDRTTTKRQG